MRLQTELFGLPKGDYYVSGFRVVERTEDSATIADGGGGANRGAGTQSTRQQTACGIYMVDVRYLKARRPGVTP